MNMNNFGGEDDDEDDEDEEDKFPANLGDSHDEAVIGGEEKKGMELAVSLSLFTSRVQEIRVPLQEHHDLLLSTLPAAECALKESFEGEGWL
ncbi:hypothetical protein J5N97_019448 [Dioscorea zingiberensis]|uniref:Uncharacterized protein n=1 Tax=Dioscorea zingiberensis TaxID=325984 RepID=A0A9D5BTD8_9LILI|nr:hypothetical protein J5N97_001726 [Dioscorea zingiberensis]KAJ0971489.1 hypothetical protein J5N97_019448 [Dioscorea zingiberensis]